eukprot:1247129-Pyramimonas_sp.AAC.1
MHGEVNPHTARGVSWTARDSSRTAVVELTHDTGGVDFAPHTAGGWNSAHSEGAWKVLRHTHRR